MYKGNNAFLVGLDMLCRAAVTTIVITKLVDGVVAVLTPYKEPRRHSRPFHNPYASAVAELCCDKDDWGLRFDSRFEAEKVLDGAKEVIKSYGVVSKADIFEICGIEHSYTDEHIGWADLSKARIERVRYGKYMLSLPKPFHI